MAFDDKVSVVFKDNLLRCGEPKPRSMRLCRKERLEQSCLNLRRNTAAGILYSNNEESLDHIRFALHNTFAFSSLHPVANEVPGSLTHQAFVTPAFRRR